MRFLFLDKEMPKNLYYDEEQRKTAIKEHKKKCYYKHKECSILNMLAFRNIIYKIIRM